MFGGGGSDLSRHSSLSLDNNDQGGGPGPGQKLRPEEENHVLWRRLQLSKAKLKGVTEMAALMAGFSVIATVELTIAKGTSEALLVLFTLTTALLVSTTMLSIMIATCILPHLEAVTKFMEVTSISVALSGKAGPHHDEVSFYIDLAWFLANTISIFLFIVDVILLCWIKFPRTEAICVTSIMIPVIIILCTFSIIFYRQTVSTQIVLADKRLDELKAISLRLDKEEEEKTHSANDLDYHPHHHLHHQHQYLSSRGATSHLLLDPHHHPYNSSSYHHEEYYRGGTNLQLQDLSSRHGGGPSNTIIDMEALTLIGGPSSAASSPNTPAVGRKGSPQRTGGIP